MKLKWLVFRVIPTVGAALSRPNVSDRLISSRSIFVFGLAHVNVWSGCANEFLRKSVSGEILNSFHGNISENSAAPPLPWLMLGSQTIQWLVKTACYLYRSTHVFFGNVSWRSFRRRIASVFCTLPRGCRENHAGKWSEGGVLSCCLACYQVPGIRILAAKSRSHRGEPVHGLI